MFVGAAVAGLVIMAADGVKARGALLRDVSCYLIAVGTVGLVLASGSVTWATAVALLLMYLLFVAVVLAADIHHIWQSSFRRGPPPVSACTCIVAAQPLHPCASATGRVGVQSDPQSQLRPAMPCAIRALTTCSCSRSAQSAGKGSGVWTQG